MTGDPHDNETIFSAEDELFSQLEEAESSRIDPELRRMFDLLRDAQTRLDNGGDHDQIIEELNNEWIYYAENVSVTGTIFGAYRDPETDGLKIGEISIDDEELLSRGFNTIPDPSKLNEAGERPLIVYYFDIKEDLRQSDDTPLFRSLNTHSAVALIDNVRIESKTNFSLQHAGNIAREIFPEQTAEIEAIFAGNPNRTEALLNLKDVSMPVPMNQIEVDGSRALIWYAQHLAKIDTFLPYSMTIQGEYLENITDTDAGVSSTGGLPEVHIGTVRGLNLHAIPIIVKETEATATTELHWSLEVELYSPDSSEGVVMTGDIPIVFILSLMPIREFFYKIGSDQ